MLVGSAVRMAECMGLHRDGEMYGLNPLETHVRRLLWHQLCFLDIRTCEAQGPKPAIRREDYDTKMPVNCEEDELTPQLTTPPKSAERWTSTLLVIVRFEINELMRLLWHERRRLESHKTTLTSVLSKIENFRKGMFEKYGRFLDDSVPIQRYTKVVMHMLMYRLHAMILHPYHTNTAAPMPARLNSVLIRSGIMIIELAMRLETDPIFRDWVWYMSAYHQFQIAMLLTTELYYHPDNKDADRIWDCLDYVFNLEPSQPRAEKSMLILTEIMSKTSIYANRRKVRAPTTTAQAVPDKNAVKPVETQQQQQKQQRQQKQQTSPSHHQQQQVSPNHHQQQQVSPNHHQQQQVSPSHHQHQQVSPNHHQHQQVSPNHHQHHAYHHQYQHQHQNQHQNQHQHQYHVNQTEQMLLQQQMASAGFKEEPGLPLMMHNIPPMPQPQPQPQPAVTMAANMSMGPTPQTSPLAAGLNRPPPMVGGGGGGGGGAVSMIPQNVVYAGISNGEVIWTLPQHLPESPENSSDGGSAVGMYAGQQQSGGGGMMGRVGPSAVESIDWVRPFFTRSVFT